MILGLVNSTLALMEMTPAEAVRGGVQDTLPFALAIVAFGAAFGLHVTESGFAWWWAPAFGIFVFAGSLEFLLVDLALGGASLATVALTSLLVNSRHAFYALSHPLHRVRGRRARAYAMYAMTDDSYALTTGRPPEDMPGSRVLAVSAAVQAWWVAGGLLGALGGAALGDIEGAEFALTATFVILALQACRTAPDRVAPVIGLVCGLLAVGLVPAQALLVGSGALVLILTLMFLSGSTHA